MRTGIRLLIVAAALWCFCAATALAASTVKTETIDIAEDVFNIQIIATGSSGYPFEANLELPDGTIYNHDKYDPNKVLYLKMNDSERIWIINVAKPGQYKLHIKGEDQAYELRVKGEKNRPEINWVSPKDTRVSVSDQLSLTWTALGDYTDEDEVQFYIRNINGWEWMHLGEARIGAGQADIAISGRLPKGEYVLKAVADNKTEEGQIVEPNATVVVEGLGVESESSFAVTRVLPKGDRVEIQFDLPKSEVPIEVYGRWTPQAGDAIEAEGLAYDIYPIEQSERPDHSRYSWTMLLPEGSYTGHIQLLLENGSFSEIAEVPAFHVKNRDWSQDKVSWSIEGEMTNAALLHINLGLQAAAKVQVLDSADGLLFEKELEQAYDIEVPLGEGDRMITLVMMDDGGSLWTEERRYLVDRTPPMLTMIQPQSKHEKLHGGMISGFTETDAIVIYGDKEYQPDEAGYFHIADAAKQVSLTLRDAHGNETSYYWEEQGGSFNKLWIILLLIGAFLLAATAFIIYRMKRTS